MTIKELIQQQYPATVTGNASDQSIGEAALAEFNKLGFPTTRLEEWKYTHFNKVANLSFTTDGILGDNAKTLLEKSIVKSLVANRLVFVNGTFVEDLSTILETDKSILLCSLKQAQQQYPEIVQAHFGKYARFQGEALNALNTAMNPDGAFLYVPSGKQPAHPVIVIHIVDATAAPVWAQPRNLIVLEKNASAFVIESHYATGTHVGFTNVVNEIYAGENSHLEHYKLQRQVGEQYQNNYTQIFQEAHTQINQVTLTLEGTVVRNNLHFYMNGENGNSLLYGLYINQKENHVDNHTRVDHAKPNCFSDEKYKGILMDKSTAVFNGKIMVHPDAQKTNAYQRNQNILLSNEATINTKPQLEIFADDVKCTHGATIGQLDEDPMFYLRSRGIPEDAARRMLLNAFADDIAEKIRIPELVTLLEQEIATKL